MTICLLSFFRKKKKKKNSNPNPVSMSNQQEHSTTVELIPKLYNMTRGVTVITVYLAQGYILI